VASASVRQELGKVRYGSYLFFASDPGTIPTNMASFSGIPSKLQNLFTFSVCMINFYFLSFFYIIHNVCSILRLGTWQASATVAIGAAPSSGTPGIFLF